MSQTPKKLKYPIKRYILMGKICCWLTIFYNIGEGTSSIILGEEESSISLVAFGIQSFVETTSSVLVLIRFYYLEKHNIKERVCESEDQQSNNNDNDIEQKLNGEDEELKAKKFLKTEKTITITIGVFFVVLSIITIVVSSLSLVSREEPSSTLDNIIISIIGLVCTVIFWYIKNMVSKVLNSSALAGDAACNLACIKLTIVLLIGSLVFYFWKGGWWVDSSIAIILALFFLKEGIQMLKWGMSKNFNGGCGDCCNGGKKSEGENNNNPCNTNCSSSDQCSKNDKCTKPEVFQQQNQCGSNNGTYINNNNHQSSNQCSRNETCTKPCQSSNQCESNNGTCIYSNKVENCNKNNCGEEQQNITVGVCQNKGSTPCQSRKE